MQILLGAWPKIHVAKKGCLGLLGVLWNEYSLLCFHIWQPFNHPKIILMNFKDLSFSFSQITIWNRLEFCGFKIVHFENSPRRTVRTFINLSPFVSVWENNILTTVPTKMINILPIFLGLQNVGELILPPWNLHQIPYKLVISKSSLPLDIIGLFVAFEFKFRFLRCLLSGFNNHFDLFRICIVKL